MNLRWKHALPCAVVAVIMLAFTSCSNDIKDAGYYEFGLSNYFVCTYGEETKEELKDYVSKWAHPNKTTWFFFYNKNNSKGYLFSNPNLDESSFKSKIGGNKPDFVFYISSPYDTVEDAMYLWSSF